MSVIEARGIIKHNVVELDERPALLALEGARVKVRLELEESLQSSRLTTAEETRRDAWTRARARMAKGYNLGGTPYPKREELYDRVDLKSASRH